MLDTSVVKVSIDYYGNSPTLWFYTWTNSKFNYPARMRWGKVIGRVVVVDTKIAESGDVHT